MLLDSWGALGRAILAPVTLSLAAAAAAPARAGAVLESLRIEPVLVSIAPGNDVEFTVIGLYSDGSRRDVTRKAKLSSSDTAVAKPAGKNLVVGASSGESEIRAALGRTLSAEPARLRVSPIAALAIEPEAEGIRLGSLVALEAVATLADGSEDGDVTALLEWQALDRRIVSVGNGRRDRGLAQGRALGATQVIAKDPKTGVTAIKFVEVVKELVDLQVTPELRLLQLDEARRFRAVGSFAAAGGRTVEADVTSDVRWLSSDRRVATIDREGRPRPRMTGDIIVGAVDRRTRLASSDTGGDAVLIVLGAVLELTVEPSAVALELGEDERFDALALFVGYPERFSWRRRVEWSSSDSAVAAIDAAGNVRCESAGSATLSARDPKTGVTSTATGGDGHVTCQ